MPERVVNVEVPDLNPDETARIWRRISHRKPWKIYSMEPEGGGGPPSDPPNPPPTDRGEPEPEERPQPFPVAEIDMSQMQDLVVNPEPNSCGRCGSTEHLRFWGRAEQDNSSSQSIYFCVSCWEILKP